MLTFGRRNLVSQLGYSQIAKRMSRANVPDSSYTQERLGLMADLSWKLSNECEELTVTLQPIAKELEVLHVQFRKAKERLSQGILDRNMQDILLNTCDGCYGILNDLSQQIERNHQGGTADTWRAVVWGEDQMNWRKEMLVAYSQGLVALNSAIGR